LFTEHGRLSTVSSENELYPSISFCDYYQCSVLIFTCLILIINHIYQRHIFFIMYFVIHITIFYLLVPVFHVFQEDAALFADLQSLLPLHPFPFYSRQKIIILTHYQKEMAVVFLIFNKINRYCNLHM